MAERPVLTRMPWRRRMHPRDPEQDDRRSTPLELFFDLCFVVAVAQDAARLEHALAEGHAATGVVSYLLVFFAIWWAWMGFSWFASGYDADDVPYRVCTMVVIAGVLVLAAGISPAFEHRDFAIAFLGYVVLRAGLEVLRLRAAAADPARRVMMLRYAAGETGCMAGWAVVIFALPAGVMIWGWLVMAAVELAVPAWAERAARMRWHPEHIAERYGLFTIIVLGESLLSATDAVQEGLTAGHGSAALYLTAGGGLLTVFAMWWLYFSMRAARLLTGFGAAIRWGYGHYVIFASVAAAGAGIGVNVARAAHHAELPAAAAGAAVTVPVTCFLVMVWLLQVRPHGPDAPASWTIPLAGVPVLATTSSGAAVPLTGLLMTLLVCAGVVLHARKEGRAVAGGLAGGRD